MRRGGHALEVESMERRRKFDARERDQVGDKNIYYFLFFCYSITLLCLVTKFRRSRCDLLSQVSYLDGGDAISSSVLCFFLEFNVQMRSGKRQYIIAEYIIAWFIQRAISLVESISCIILRP